MRIRNWKKVGKRTWRYTGDKELNKVKVFVGAGEVRGSWQPIIRNPRGRAEPITMTSYSNVESAERVAVNFMRRHTKPEKLDDYLERKGL